MCVCARARLCTCSIALPVVHLFLRLYAVGGRDGSSCLRSVECFDPHTNRSEKRDFEQATFTKPVLITHAPYLGFYLLPEGKFVGESVKSVCSDLHLNCRWTSCAPMAKRRGGVGVATWHGFLYAIGGHDAPASSLSSRLSDCVERWVHVWSTPKTPKQVRRAGQMSRPCSHPCCLSAGTTRRQMCGQLSPQ